MFENRLQPEAIRLCSLLRIINSVLPKKKVEQHCQRPQNLCHDSLVRLVGRGIVKDRRQCGAIDGDIPEVWGNDEEISTYIEVNVRSAW